MEWSIFFCARKTRDARWSLPCDPSAAGILFPRSQSQNSTKQSSSALQLHQESPFGDHTENTWIIFYNTQKCVVTRRECALKANIPLRELCREPSINPSSFPCFFPSRVSKLISATRKGAHRHLQDRSVSNFSNSTADGQELNHRYIWCLFAWIVFH